MKTINFKAFAATVFTMLTFTACVNSEDINSSTSGATENPLSETVATNGADQNWSNIRTVNLTVTVNDEYLGEYNYGVTVYDSIPISSDAAAHALVAGTAKTGKDFTASFSVPSSLTQLYVQQTDPRGRKSVRVYTLSQGIDVATATISFAESVASASKYSISKRGITESQVTVPTPTVYTSIPSNAVELGNHQVNSWDSFFNSSTNYKVTGSYSKLENHWNTGNTVVYVSGTWDITNAAMKQLQSGITLIVMPGGIVKASSLALVGNSSLYIMKGGTLIADNLAPSNGSGVYNYGTLTLGSLTDNYKEFYNGTGATTSITGSMATNVSSNVYNLGKLTVGTLGNNPGIIYNAADAEAHFGTLNVESGGTTGSVINYGKMYANTVKISSSNYLFTACCFETTGTMDLSDANVSLAGGRLEANKLLFNNSKIEMKDASSIKAIESIDFGYNPRINGTGANNLVKAPTMTFGWASSLNSASSGSLTLASDHFNYSSGAVTPDDKTTLCKIADCTVVPASCGSTTTGGGTGTGTDPDNQNPTSVVNSTIYSYAFEDNWPVYGDYDMNDAVIYLNQSTKQLNSEGKVTSFTLKGTAMAAGATKPLQFLIRLIGIEPSNVTGVSGASVDVDKSTVTFGSIHSFLGTSIGITNTVVGSNTVAPRNFEVTFTFPQPVTQSALDVSNLDVFIVSTTTNTESRTEVHLPGFAPTKWANTSQLGSANSLSSENPYLSKSVDANGNTVVDGLCFGMMIPEKFYWPIEYQRINKTYNYFAEWVRSNGISYTDWYKYKTEGYSNTNYVYPVENLPATK